MLILINELCHPSLTPRVESSALTTLTPPTQSVLGTLCLSDMKLSIKDDGFRQMSVFPHPLPHQHQPSVSRYCVWCGGVECNFIQSPPPCLCNDRREHVDWRNGDISQPSVTTISTLHTHSWLLTPGFSRYNC